MSTPRLHRAILFLFLGGVALACCSCGGRERVYPVTGKILYEGWPTPGAVVFLHPVENKSPDALRPHATVQEDGSFQLTTYRDNDGAPAGVYFVTVSWTRPIQPGERDEVGQLPVRYQYPEGSGFRVEVKTEPTELPPFQLTR